MATKKRLIDAKALFNDLADYWGIPKDWDGRIEQTCEDALSAIENAPEVDAVEVVRCKDCFWSEFDYCEKRYYCNHPYGLNYEIEENYFCYHGERENE